MGVSALIIIQTYSICLGIIIGLLLNEVLPERKLFTRRKKKWTSKKY